MSAAEFDRVRRNFQEFQSLDPGEQQQLRELYSELKSHPDRVRLISVMKRYHAWVRRLNPADRNELLSAPPAERMAKVTELRKRQQSRRRRGGPVGFGARGGLPRPIGGGFGRGGFGRRSFGRNTGARPPQLAWLEERVRERLSEDQRTSLDAARGFDRWRLILEFVDQQRLLAGTEPLPADKVSPEQLRQLIAVMPGDEEGKELQSLPLRLQRLQLGWRLRLSVRFFRLWRSVPQIPESELEDFKNQEVAKSPEVSKYLDRQDSDSFKRELTILYLIAHPEKNSAREANPPSADSGTVPETRS